jgi:hypothetical protein
MLLRPVPRAERRQDLQLTRVAHALWLSCLVTPLGVSFALSACGGSSSSSSAPAAEGGKGGGSGGTSASGGRGGAGSSGKSTTGGGAGTGTSGGKGGSGPSAGGSSAGGSSAGKGGSPSAAGGAGGGRGGSTGNHGGAEATAGGGGDAGATTGGAAGSENGTSGRGGSAGKGGAGGSGGAPIEPCDSGVTSTDPCSTTDSVCGMPSSDTCCLCTDFAQPACDLQWVCATPANNAGSCPSDAPDLGSGCPSSGLTCSYCTDRGPLFVRCGRQSTGADPTWAETPGGACAS